MAISEESFQDLVAAVNTEIFQHLQRAWKDQTIASYLNSIGLGHLTPQEAATYWEDSCKDGKIIILGAPTIKEREIMATLKSEHIAKNRIEIHLGYEELKNFDFKKLRYNNKYRLILVGAMPHSTSGKGDFSSAIANMEQTDGYPKLIRLCSNEQLKITKTNLRQAIHNEIESGYLAA